MNQTIDTITSPLFDKVRDAMDDAVLVAWDGCHKIYAAMDATEADWFRANYDNVVEDTPALMLVTVGQWWEASCPLRFVNAVRHDAVDPNAGFTSLIAQGEDTDDDDDYDDAE